MLQSHRLPGWPSGVFLEGAWHGGRGRACQAPRQGAATAAGARHPAGHAVRHRTGRGQSAAGASRQPEAHAGEGASHSTAGASAARAWQPRWGSSVLTARTAWVRAYRCGPVQGRTDRPGAAAAASAAAADGEAPVPPSGLAWGRAAAAAARAAACCQSTWGSDSGTAL